MESLLDKVKKIERKVGKGKKHIATDEELEVAIAYALHEVTASQVEKALGLNTATAQSFVHKVLYKAVQDGRLVRK